MKTKVSLIWMTRKRESELVFSLTSFIVNADDNTNVEYIIVGDPDDPGTEKALSDITLMAHPYDTELIYLKSDKHYGYTELEQYQNQAGKVFTGDCLMIMNDDVVCMDKGWDTKIRNSIDEKLDKPIWLGLTPMNEYWKGTPNFVGINRKWYETTGRVSGTRATDGYIKLVGNAAKIEMVDPKFNFLHLQRGKANFDYNYNGETKVAFGLPDDGAGGYPTKNPIPPKYEFHEGLGKVRLEEDVLKLKEFSVK